MGQQQLILITLVTIIIGLATIIAISLFKSEKVFLIEDNYTELLLETADNLQVYWHKPSILGGGNHSFKDADFAKIPCLLDEIKYTNFNCQTTDEKYLINILDASSVDSINIAAIINLNGEYLEAKYTVKANSITILKKWGPL